MTRHGNECKFKCLSENTVFTLAGYIYKSLRQEGENKMKLIICFCFMAVSNVMLTGFTILQGLVVYNSM